MILLDLCNKLCLSLSVWTSALCDRDLNIRHFMQTGQPNVFIPAMLIGTIDFCHFDDFH